MYRHLIEIELYRLAKLFVQFYLLLMFLLLKTNVVAGKFLLFILSGSIIGGNEDSILYFSLQ